MTRDRPDGKVRSINHKWMARLLFFRSAYDNLIKPKPDLCVISGDNSLESVDWIKQQLGHLALNSVPSERVIILLVESSGKATLPKKDLENAFKAARWKAVPKTESRTWLTELAREMIGAMSVGPVNGAGAPSEETALRLEKQLVRQLWGRFAEDPEIAHLSNAQLKEKIGESIRSIIWEGHHQALLDSGRLRELVERLSDHILGLGPLEPLLADPAIGEIMINGPDRIYVEQAGAITPAGVEFAAARQLDVVIERMVGSVGRRVDASSPMCDVRLKDGSRVNVIIPPLSLQGPVVTIRRFRTCFMSIDDLIEAGTLNREQANTLIDCVRSRKNILVAGNTGSGKTTLLNILSEFIDDKERIITLEDAAELQLKQAHVVRLETRLNNSEGQGAVDMSALLINALRMRPDRLLVGECRGPEVLPMLQAMNTGHDGSMTTLHANSARDALERLEALTLMAAGSWPVHVVRNQIRTAIDVVVYLKRIGTKRLLEEIHCVKSENASFPRRRESRS